MLTTYLNNRPYSRFVFIEDSLIQPGKDLLKYIVDGHIKNSKCIIHYLVFEGNFERIRTNLGHSNVQCYDFVSDPKGWLNRSTYEDFPTRVSQINTKGAVVVIDSLSHAIFQCGIATIYKFFQQLLAEDVTRIVTILHHDLCEDIVQTSASFQHLSTLALSLEPKFNSDNGRISYVYRKPGGRIIKKVEEYKFEKGILKTEPIQTIDPKILVQQSVNQVQPENLSTFRIGLNEKEKESRNKLVLPYLPKEPGQSEQEEAKIFYQFDHVDDWDEEDPDDDLDI